jgi:hypothetical protein
MSGQARISSMPLATWAQHPTTLKAAIRKGWRVPRMWDASPDGPTVAAFINWGRWVVECPSEHCYGHLDVPRDGPHYFWCLACGGAEWSGLWLAVTFPDAAAQIEAAMETIPNQMHRNWQPVGG